MNKENILNDNWKILKFKECILQLNTGLNPRNHFSLGKGKIKYITAKNLTKSGPIDFSKCDFIDEKAKAIINKRSNIKIGDILFSSRSPVGYCHLIKEEPNYFDIGESIFSIRVNKEIVLPEYLCFYLSSNHFVKLASKNVTGSIIQEIRISNLMNTDIIIPPKDVQKYIAKTLTNIDKKIELNNKINFELENMAKTIYGYWFLQFEFPNNEGKPYKSSGGKMVWNEELKKEIPDGWEAKKLINYCSLKNGINYNNEELSGEKYKIINVRNISSSTLFINDSILDKISISSDIANKYTIDEDDILIARSGTPGQVRIIKSNENIIYSGFIIKCKVNEIRYKEYFVYVLKKIENSILNQSNGSILKNINQESLSNLTIIIPSMECINNFNNKVIAIHNKIKNLMEENQELISLRDYLLPLLMNGQIGFKD